MPDYQKSIEFGNFWIQDIAPYLQHVVERSMSFAEYLESFYRKTTAFKSFGLPVPYCYSLEWLKTYKDKCVTFNFNPPEELAKGAPIMSVIYQFSPTLHGSASVNYWINETNEKEGYIGLFLLYEDFQEALKFCEDNMQLLAKDKEKGVGFFNLPKNNVTAA